MLMTCPHFTSCKQRGTFHEPILGQATMQAKPLESVPGDVYTWASNHHLHCNVPVSNLERRSTYIRRCQSSVHCRCFDSLDSVSGVGGANKEKSSFCCCF